MTDSNVDPSGDAAPVATDTGPFAVVPLWLVDVVAETKPRSMGSALAVYVALHAWADRRARTCWPSQRAIGDKAGGLSVSTVQEALNLLRQVGAVSWTATRTEHGDPGPNRYMLHRTDPRLAGGGHPVDRVGVTRPTGGGSPGGPGTNQSHMNQSHMNQKESPAEADSLPVVVSESPNLEHAKRLCDLLADLMVENGCKRPKVTAAWITDMDRLIRIDGRSPEQVETAIRWCQAHEFWRSNILSPAKLRAKYDAMRLQARREQQQREPRGFQAIRDFLAAEREDTL